MCYPKPGPRCSAHARQRLDAAKRKHDLALMGSDQEKIDRTRGDLLVAVLEYDSTKDGQRVLQSKINSLVGSGSDESLAQELIHRQERGCALRAEQMKALHDVQRERALKKYLNMTEVKDAHEALGGTFFSPESLEVNKTRLGTTLYGGKYFVSSDLVGGSRWYTVRRIADGEIECASKLNEFPKVSIATAAAKRFSRG